MDQETRKKFEIGFSVVLFAFFALLFIISLGYPPRPRELPLLIDAVGMVLIGYHLISVILRPIEKFKKSARKLNWKVFLVAATSMIIYLISTYFIGMVISSFAILYGCGLAFGAKNKKTLAIVSVVTVIGIYFIFDVMLKVNLYKGILFGG